MGRALSTMGNWRIVVSVAGGAVVLGLGGLYVTGLVAGDDIAEGTRVRGVDIGGMSRGRPSGSWTAGLGRPSRRRSR